MQDREQDCFPHEKLETILNTKFIGSDSAHISGSPIDLVTKLPSA